jgi:hypothetical protein
MSTIRGYVGTNISADTGEVVVLAKSVSPAFDPGDHEDIVTLRMRMKTNTPQDPYAGGTMLATVRWHDGNQVQEWNVGCNTSDGNYLEAGLEIWMDGSRDLTIQVQPAVAGGSVDVLLDYVEL